MIKLKHDNEWDILELDGCIDRIFDIPQTDIGLDDFFYALECIEPINDYLAVYGENITAISTVLLQLFSWEFYCVITVNKIVVYSDSNRYSIGEIV